jgi:hypothetical protein
LPLLAEKPKPDISQVYTKTTAIDFHNLVIEGFKGLAKALRNLNDEFNSRSVVGTNIQVQKCSLICFADLPH